jgi:hypothetical protein
MDTWMWITVGAIVAVAVLAGGGWWMARRSRMRSEGLRRQFGSEYDRAVLDFGRKNGEKSLEARRERVQKLSLRTLEPREAQRFAELWRSTQARFVDEPGGALTDADRLVGEVMQARGYPVGSFEARAADISVDHPQVVANYRRAHVIALKHAHGGASTEECRQAMVHYRALFSDLLETQDEGDTERLREAAIRGSD